MADANLVINTRHILAAINEWEHSRLFNGTDYAATVKLRDLLNVRIALHDGRPDTPVDDIDPTTLKLGLDLLIELARWNTGTVDRSAIVATATALLAHVDA